MKKPSKMHQRVIDNANKKEAEKKGVSLLHEAVASTDDEELKEAFKALENVTIPENKFWDEATAFYHGTKEGILSTNAHIAEYMTHILANPEMREKLNGNVRLAILIDGLNRDIAGQLAELDKIYETHKEFTGGITTPDETIRIFEVQGCYSNVNEVYQTLIMPTVAEIMEICGGIEEIIQAAANQPLAEPDVSLTEEQNPSIVSDVVFKEM
jgi:hypothetical protein